MHWEDIANNLDFLAKGLFMTCQLAFVSILGSSILGIIFGVARHSKFPFVSWIATIYIEFVRSIPLILFIVFVHFGLLPYVLRIQTNFFLSAAVALIIFTAAYIAEIVRGGLKSIERGHTEAARSLGLNYFQMMAYVVLPLAISRMTPALVSQFIALIKDTSLASIIGLIELTRAGEIVYSRTFHEFEILIFIAIIYFAICYSLSILSRKLESISSSKNPDAVVGYNQ
ncbi:MAG: amino acid ABC transporter permease [Cyanobacteriota bacterium]